MGTVLHGDIIAVDGRGITAFAEYSDIQNLVDKKIQECEIILTDGRQLTPKQRNTIFALVKDITEYVSDSRKHTEVDEMLTTLQLQYVLDLVDREDIRYWLTYRYCQIKKIDLFSLGQRSKDTIDETTARGFIGWLIDLCIAFDIPCSESLLNRCEDQQRYLYTCVIHRTCCICGKPAEIHEYDFVGMGRNRETIHHLGQRVQPLCRKHHNEVGNLGQKAFDKKYHVSWVKLDEAACQRLQWKK